MRRFLGILILTLGLVASGKSLRSQDTQHITISLLTCGPGDQLYSTFGHSALRVKDVTTGYDIVYNWGTFDFDTDHFYIKFMRGKLPYFLSIARFDDFMREYQIDERYVIEQKLNLESHQKRSLLDLLNENVKPENRYYDYDFFFDNCSTRIREIVGDAVESLQWQEVTDELSWRDQLHQSLSGKPWSEFGIDLVIGSKADLPRGVEERMFLPEYLFESFEEAQYNDTTGKEDLVIEDIYILDFKENDVRRSETPFFTPHVLFLILLVIESIILLIYSNSLSFPGWVNGWHKLIMIAAGIGSLIIIFLWFFTNHQATRPNWNIIWLSPLYLIYPFLGKGLVKLIIKVLLLLSILVAMINTWLPFLPQEFNPYNLGAYLLLLLVISQMDRNENVA